jgi:hypothetical protein
MGRKICAHHFSDSLYAAVTMRLGNANTVNEALTKAAAQKSPRKAKLRGPVPMGVRGLFLF